MTDPRTPAEIAYDNLKSGAAYAKPESFVGAVLEYISEDEQKALDILLAQDGETAPDGKRFCDAIDRMFDLPEAQRMQAVAMLEGFLATGSAGERFDRAVDNLADLPEARRAAGVSLVEGFLAGVAIAATVTAPLKG